jgi:hypothetical protein
MLHGAGISTYIETPKWPSFVGKYSSTMEHLDHLGYVTVAIPETNIDLPK